MSYEDSNRFTIYKNQDNEFTFIIKQKGDVFPMEIVAGDTFSARLVKLDDLSDSGIVMSITPEIGVNGKVVLSIASAQTVGLVSERGGKADRYYSKPTYRLYLSGDTQNEGKVNITIPDVHIV